MCINCQVLIRDLVLKLLPVQENVEIRHETRKSNYVAMKVLLLNLNECVCSWKQSILYPRLNTIVILIYMPKDTKKCEKQRKNNQSKRGIKVYRSRIKINLIRNSGTRKICFDTDENTLYERTVYQIFFSFVNLQCEWNK